MSQFQTLFLLIKFYFKNINVTELSFKPLGILFACDDISLAVQAAFVLSSGALSSFMQLYDAGLCCCLLPL